LIWCLTVLAEDPPDPRAKGSEFWGLLLDFGAVTEPPQITPLGAWAIGQLGDRIPFMPEGLAAADMLLRLTRFDNAEHRRLTWQWMSGRDAKQAVREILSAAVSMSPRMRWLATDVAEEAGDDALGAWPVGASTRQ
jgi:HEAT repeat protein